MATRKALLAKKTYYCGRCGAILKHDEVHQHVQHTCPKKTKR